MIYFGAPQWFWGLAILPLLAMLYARAEQRSATMLREFIAPRLLPELAGNIDRSRRLLRFCLVLLALGLAIVALAQPRWGYTYEDVRRRGLDLLLAVDTSRSMLSNDVAPSRLDRVKLAAQDLIAELNGDRVGLIAFAGRAFLQAPLTIDYEAAIESVNDLDTKTIPEGGTNISEAIALAVRTFGKSAMGNRALIIFTDGEELSGDAVKEAGKAADEGVRIFTIGVGTPQGSLIPLQGDDGAGFVKDAKGQVVKSRLDEKRLREIADATKGIYLPLQNGPQAMRQLYEEGLARMQTGEFDARLSRRPIERYQWPLAASIGLLIASLFINDRKRRSSRRKTLAPQTGALIAASLLICAGHALGVSGLDLYKQGKFADAYAEFQKDLQRNLNPRDTAKMQFDSGVAAFQNGDYDKALESFSQSLVDSSPKLQENSRYNLGRTLEERADLRKTKEQTLQDLEGSAQHYEQTLKLNPQNADAAKHLEEVKKKIDRLKKQPKQPPPSPQQQQKKDKSQQQQQQQQNQQQEKGSDQQRSQDQQQSQSNESEEHSRNNQQAKNNKQNQQNDQDQSPNGGADQQNNQKSEQGNKGKSPEGNGKSPAPSSSPSTSPGQENSKGSDKAEGGDQSPKPEPSQSNSSGPGSTGQQGEERGPSPAEGTAESGSPTPTPASSPNKPHGEIKAASEQSDAQQKEGTEAEAAQSNEMSPQQAERLLKGMRDEEARVQLDERRPTRPVYKDW